MTPDFAECIDPIFTAAMHIEDRINNKISFVTSDEKNTLIRKIEQAEGRLGQTEDWKLAKYAICSWIDDRLINANWADSGWWKEYCLEYTFFGTRESHVEFFIKATEASRLPSKNALEIFYIAVVLGFSGFYGGNRASQTAAQLGLPPTMESWCQQVARSLHLKQGRPAIGGESQPQGSFHPLLGKKTFVSYAMASAIFIAAAVVCYVLLYHKFD